MSLPAHLNPFRVDRLESIPFFFPEGMNWSELESRLEAAGGRGSIVGPHGSGKTTLIEEWIRRLQSRGEKVIRIRLNGERRDFSRAEWDLLRDGGSETFLFVDGAEQLGVFARWSLIRLSSAFKAVVLSLHRKGRLPVLFECCVFPGLAEEILTELLGPEEAENTLPRFQAALKRRGAHLRAALFDLYDLEAGRGKFGADFPVKPGYDSLYGAAE